MNAPDLSPADRARLALWQEELHAVPGRLPVGVEPVQVRLIRAVGRGDLPDAGAVFLKTMGFPRARDRLRYWLRALPAGHEADMLEVVRRAGIPCPEVIAVFGARGPWRRPRSSTLVTRALVADPSASPRLGPCAELACRLADAGVFHPDLHAGNFVALRGGGLAVLDLQSARRCGTVGDRLRLRLAARLLAHEWDATETPRAVVDAGLVGAVGLPSAMTLARRFRARALVRRVRRCLIDSTEFVVARRGFGRLLQRRRLQPGGTWIETGRRTRRLWLGQRVAEVLAGEPVILQAAFWNSPWRRGRSSVYIADPNGVALFQDHALRWLDALRRFEGECRGVSSVPTQDLDAPLSWSGHREY